MQNSLAFAALLNGFMFYGFLWLAVAVAKFEVAFFVLSDPFLTLVTCSTLSFLFAVLGSEIEIKRYEGENGL